MDTLELQSDERVRVVSRRSRYRGRIGTVHSLTASGLSARVGFGNEQAVLRLTSLERLSPKAHTAERTNPKARTAEEAIIDLADELTRLLRIITRNAENDAGDKRGTP